MNGCGLLGLRRHLLPDGFAQRPPYLRAEYMNTDAMGRAHWALEGDCQRCGQRVVFAYIHGPLEKRRTT